MKIIFPFVLAAVLLVGCDSESLQQDDPPFVEWTVDIGDYGPHNLEGDAFELFDARIEGSQLLLDVAYSGGCTQHGFAGYSPEVNIAIFPPQITVFVVHDADGDMCEAYPAETVGLDIRSLLNTFGSVFVLTVEPINSRSSEIVIQHTS